MSDQPFKRVKWAKPTVYLGWGAAAGKPSQTYWTASQTLDALVISQGNPKRNGKYVRGGPFFAHHREDVVYPSMEVVIDYAPPSSYAGKTFRSTRFVPNSCPYKGVNTPPVLPDWTIPSWPDVRAGLIPWGAIGYARARPGNPSADLATSLGELYKEGLPRIPGILQRRVGVLANLGSQYLNVVFGWLPLLRSIDDMLKTAQTQQKQIQQLIRDHGSLVRRKRELGTQKSSSSSVLVHSGMGGFFPPILNTIAGAPGSNSRTTIENWTITRRWFEGGFRYHIPGYSIRDFSWIPRMRRRLYGADITPSVLYNLMPWSWLVDWFTNVGSVMENISRNAVGFPVAEYAFVMETKEIVTRHTTRGYLPGGTAGGYTNGKSYDLIAVWEQRSLNRARVPATPYGFGLTYDGLSDQQKAILAALGMSRARF